MWVGAQKPTQAGAGSLATVQSLSLRLSALHSHRCIKSSSGKVVPTTPAAKTLLTWVRGTFIASNVGFVLHKLLQGLFASSQAPSTAAPTKEPVAQTGVSRNMDGCSAAESLLGAEGLSDDTNTK